MCWRTPSTNDGDRNWSLFKKEFVTFSISLLAFSIYIGSAIAIYTMSEIGIVKEFKVKVSQVKATLDLTLYILAYGIGPMLLTPLQEMALYGRNPVCIISLAIFVIFNLPIVVPHNFSVILAFRFFTRFTGGPALVTRGASMANIFPGSKLSYIISICALDAVGGPILSPVIVSPIYTLNLYILTLLKGQIHSSSWKLVMANVRAHLDIKFRTPFPRFPSHRDIWGQYPIKANETSEEFDGQSEPA